jgi:hypothetical protein
VSAREFHLNLTFPHTWHARILPARPLILPRRSFVYPQHAEEVERGALELLIEPGVPPAEPFLATCALGFRDAAVPTGVWACPRPSELCAVAGGYAYLIDTAAPERFTMLPFRPVLEVHLAAEQNLLLFVGHHAILAWGVDGLVWESAKLSDEGVTVTSIEGGILRGVGWEMQSDREVALSLNLRNGLRL